MLSVAICFFATIILWHYQSLLPLDKNCCNNLLLLFLLPRLATVLKWWQYVSIATILATNHFPSSDREVYILKESD